MFVVIAAALCLFSGASAQKNVLFLAADDMAPYINAYEDPDPVHPPMHTPNLDALAARSLLLKKAYVQQAICSPSRTSLMTGRRPDTTHVYNLQDYFRIVGGNYTTIPEYFKANGYRSIGMGKIFHSGDASGKDDPPSWTEDYFRPKNGGYWNSNNASWQAVTLEDRLELPLPDEEVAENAIKTIEELAQNPDEPFFLAVGFQRPHLPFTFPEEFLEYYPEEDMYLPDNPYAPVNMPNIAWSSYSELRSYYDIDELGVTGDINTTMPDFKTLELRRAYYCAVSFTDFLVGEVIQALTDAGLAENTIISFWGDHGWQLGEHGEWCKHTNFEIANHAPMMIHVPGLTDDGIITEELTEFVDLYPTLVDAAGLPSLPLCPSNSTEIQVCREGTSLMPLITDTNPNWKKRVFSQYARRSNSIMGYSMKTAEFRYTEWVAFDAEPNYLPDWDDNIGTELYDHRIDPQENWNHAGEEEYEEIEKELSQQLRAGWREAMPEDTSVKDADHTIQ